MNIERAASPCHPYPAYKPSGVPWLGDVPAHWEVMRAKYYYRESQEVSASGAEELMSVSHRTGVTPRKDNVTMFLAESNVGYKICRPDDIVINTMWAYMAALGVARQVGIVSPSYGVYRPREPGLLNLEYVDALLRTDGYRTEYNRRSTGITDSRLRLYPEQFLEIPLLRPPLAEQAAIVRYLGHADQLINRYISAKERLIALLEEQRQAVIHRAVTRGLDPNVRLKPSGVEWLGDVPAHWEVRRLKHWVGINEAVLPENTDPYFEFRYLEIGAVGAGTLVSEPVKTRFGNAPSRARRIVRTGDTIVSTVRTYLKATWFAEDVKDDLICSTGFAVFTPRKAVWPNFVGYITQSNALTDRVTAASVGTAYPAIAESRLGAFHVALPPLDEQAAIVEYLDGLRRALTRPSPAPAAR